MKTVPEKIKEYEQKLDKENIPESLKALLLSIFKSCTMNAYETYTELLFDNLENKNKEKLEA